MKLFRKEIIGNKVRSRYDVSKLLYSEKEVINLLLEMISSSLAIREFIKNKNDYLND